MKTETNEVKTFITRLYCDCGEEMRMKSATGNSAGSQYFYECPKCYAPHNATERYPAIEYQRIEQVSHNLQIREGMGCWFIKDRLGNEVTVPK